MVECSERIKKKLIKLMNNSVDLLIFKLLNNIYLSRF